MKKTTLFFLAAFSFINAYAQKLPSVQQVSLRAPVNIKIDGKATEWNDKYLAYNINNRIYYTLANDDKYLYVSMRAADRYSSEKAIFGITFSAKLPDNSSVKFTYPSVGLMPNESNYIRLLVAGSRKIKDVTAPQSKLKLDSLSSLGTKKVSESFKLIDVSGIKAIKEASISIYNAQDISAAARFNAEMYYVYEAAIPLNYLIKGTETKIRYNIKINGIPVISANGIPTPTVERRPGEDDLLFVDTPTNLSGEYTLAQ